MSRADVDNFKAFLLTHDQRFHPDTIEKQAAFEHSHHVNLWKHALLSWDSLEHEPPYQDSDQNLVAAVPNAQDIGYYSGYTNEKTLGQEKEARCGHPNNVAMARMFRPGMFPGLDENRGMRFRFSGDWTEAQQRDWEESFSMSRETQEYLYGKQADENGHEVKSTQTEDITKDPEAHGVAIKEQKITTDPKIAGNEKTASTSGRNWWFNHV